MATIRISRAQYDALVAAYREKPGQHSNAARRAGVGFRTAKLGWERGWDRPPWARCIRKVLEEDAIAARKVLEEREAEKAADSAVRRKERDLARLDAIEERAREAQAVRAAMSNAMGLLAVTGALAKASVALAQGAARDIVADAQGEKIPWEQAVDTLKRLSWLSYRASGVTRSSMEMLRLHLGEPEQVIAIVGEGPRVDGEMAAETLGDETLRKAILDLANGEMSEAAAKLVDFQSRVGNPGQRGNGSGTLIN